MIYFSHLDNYFVILLGIASMKVLKGVDPAWALRLAPIVGIVALIFPKPRVFGRCSEMRSIASQGTLETERRREAAWHDSWF